MRRIVQCALTLVLVALGMSGSITAITTPANATTNGCDGASCNGQDPSGRCDDGITVAAMAVTDGMLELRYSPSCKANWGRYTPYTRTASTYSAAKIGIYARVTVWNPGSPSYGTAVHANSIYGSSWSQMTDGRPMACTGVEVVHSFKNGDYQSQGWTWGPCV